MGLYHLTDPFSYKLPIGKQRVKAIIKLLLLGIVPTRAITEKSWELHKNYILFQEFLPGNDFDHRIVVIGNRAFGFKRFNRPNDFRASGSGNVDINPENVDLEAVRLSLRLAKRLKTQSIAIDVMRRGEERVVGEMSYTYPHRTVHSCPGHWELTGDAQPHDLKWVSGQMWPEEAQIADFLDRLHSSGTAYEMAM